MGVVRDDQPDAREGQAGRVGVAERPVMCAGQRVSQGGLKSPRRSDEERRIRKRG